MSESWYKNVPRSTLGFTFFGVFILVFFVFGFGFWSTTAQIAGAVVTSGTFVKTGENKIVQHLEGGVIKDIHVREGDFVDKGELLLELDDVLPRAEHRRLQLREIRLMASLQRLDAEITESENFEIDQSLLGGWNEIVGSDNLDHVLYEERMLFQSNMDERENEVAALQRSIDALEERISGSETQISAIQEQVVLIEEELNGKLKLFEKGLILKPEILALRRAKANLSGEIGRLIGEIGDARERIARAEEQIEGVKTQARKQAIEKLREDRNELKDVREQLRASENIVDRVRVVAPVSGVIVKLQYHTSGGVIEAGKPILELVPNNAELVIQARVRPQDIDDVRLGQKASIRLTALNSRTTPIAQGSVIYVSADAMPDETVPVSARDDVYVARVRMSKTDVERIRDFDPTPGMPVELYIKTAERTFLSYLLKPIEDSMARAFRED
ncbi:MAG: HlyD family type I secretion periplasmic adaptor subunit [Pseudomonadota bacterium]